MKMYEGTPQELHEFLEAQRNAESQSGATSTEEQPQAISAEIERFVRERARDEDTCRRMIDYLTRVEELGTNYEPGKSTRSKSGLTDYIKVYANGPRMSGAVSYVMPRQATMDLRLYAEDVADLNDRRVVMLKRKGNRPYVVRCHLSDDAAVDLALELTERALKRVRP